MHAYALNDAERKAENSLLKFICKKKKIVSVKISGAEAY